MRGMGELNDRFGVYSAHLGNVIADTTKQCDRATLQCKYNKFTEANILLRSAFLSDLLLPAKTSTLRNLELEKEYLERNVLCLIQDTIKCFKQRYGDLMDEANEDATNTGKETTEGDRLL